MKDKVNVQPEKKKKMATRASCTGAAMRWPVQLIIAIGLLLLCSASARAQWTPYATPEFEASGSYSFMRANGANSGGFNLNGGSGAFTYNFTHWFAAVGDTGWYQFGGLPSGLNSYMVTYAAGPRITFRSHRHFIPFVQLLAGGARVSATSGGIHAAENGFLLMPGAGIDLDLHHHFAIRALQVDYLATRFGQNDGSTGTQNNFRISAGIVFRIGDR